VIVHHPIMPVEVLRHLAPRPGDLVVDCTLGSGGHARAILEQICPGGRLVGVDLDPLALRETEAQLRAEGFGHDVFVAVHASFAILPQILTTHSLAAADGILVDLGISAMQKETPGRGFNYKIPGPLDMRLDPTRGETAAALLARLTEADLAAVLTGNADEPHAELIARLIKAHAPETTHALERLVRTGVAAALPALPKSDIKMSVRRTFQALRIAVNDELHALDALLAALPHCLAPGGRATILTFHSGEDRLVKKAFLEGSRAGIYSAIARQVIRSTQQETYTNRRAQAAKLRWAVRSSRTMA
jgi:16S rRNA (cytosine1402-N4)-methyltransferase